MTISQPTSIFAPETVAAINRAYDKAIGIVGAAAEQTDLRLAVADHVMCLARKGENDERRLCRLAVLAVLGRFPDDAQDGADLHVNDGR
ncbi:hypothetical protein P7D22_03425 [Lichenihabitans sp. Uapishka_5]|uniref:hypothetical protein n=1 Tax=Lichenihabitans sp. Uapishka_5 TaxID=3037302 RepID=UPI0029E8192F|nr:hypothetical protein [Lichenihabitans sp. Uapishka_5]MDX7950229.1 hypothetical protein [Lichenihabitans sp. Uapishka_5]